MRKLKIVLIRHGCTEGNVRKAFEGCKTDSPLTEETRAEAKVLAGKLKALGGDKSVVCSSPIARAFYTAGILFEGKKIHTVENLKEIDFGILEGKTHEELDGNPDYQAWIDSGLDGDVPGGDTIAGFRARCMEGLKECVDIALSEEETDTLFMVCHGGPIMATMSGLTGEEFYSFLTGNLNGYVLDTEIDDEGIHVTAYRSLDDGGTA